METQYRKYVIEFTDVHGQAFSPDTSHLTVYVFASSREDAVNRAVYTDYEPSDEGIVSDESGILLMVLRSKDPHIDFAILSINIGQMNITSCRSMAMGRLKGKKELVEKLRNWECSEVMNAICGKKGTQDGISGY